MLTVLVAANLVRPEVLWWAGRFFMIAVAVSTVFAVRKVPEYSMRMRRNGFEVRKRCGRKANSMSEDVIEARRVERDEARSMIPLVKGQ